MAVSQESAVPSLQSARLLDSYQRAGPPLASEDFDDEEFEDALEEDDIEPGTYMGLEESFEDCDVAMKKFFNNDVMGALLIVKPWGTRSLYHSLGTAMFEFIPAMLTFEHAQISRALAALKVCIGICNKHRRNYSLVESIGTMIRKPNYATYTDMEAHAELCYAEALLLQAAMTVMEGEDLSGLIRGTFKVKHCYTSYKDCSKIAERKQWSSEASKVNFESGVRLGVAAFSLMISLLPPRVISLLEFVGFTGNKKFGLSELALGSRSPGLRSPLCDLTLLAYHLVICHFIGGEGDFAVCEDILKKELKIYPNGVWFLIFKARLDFMKGRYASAVSTYNSAIDSQSMWKQFRHVAYWEIMWIHAIRMSWRDSAAFAQKLLEESSWSRTIYCYTQAAMLMQLPESAPFDRQRCIELVCKAPLHKQRIAGKSLPTEKFMLRRCERWRVQGRLVLPGVELLCIWNMFPVLASNAVAAQNMMRLIEAKRAELDSTTYPWEAGYEADNRALVRFLHGSLLAAMRLPRLALEVLDSVFHFRNDLKEDQFLLPWSMVDIAMCHYRLGDSERALQMLHTARKKYSGYSLESRLHFRIHAKIGIIKDSMGRQAPELDAASAPQDASA